MLTKKESIIMLLIFAAIAAILAGIYWYSLKPERFKGPAEPPRRVEPPAREEEKEERTSTGVLIPEEVHVYSGVLQETGNAHIIIKAASHNNYLVQDQILKISFNEQTKFIRYILPKAIPPDVKFIEGTEEPISSSQIQKGDRVEVYSRENLLGKTEFKADVIRVLEF